MRHLDELEQRTFVLLGFYERQQMSRAALLEQLWQEVWSVNPGHIDLETWNTALDDQAGLVLAQFDDAVQETRTWLSEECDWCTAADTCLRHRQNLGAWWDSRQDFAHFLAVDVPERARKQLAAEVAR